MAYSRLALRHRSSASGRAVAFRLMSEALSRPSVKRSVDADLGLADSHDHGAEPHLAVNHRLQSADGAVGVRQREGLRQRVPGAPRWRQNPPARLGNIRPRPT